MLRGGFGKALRQDAWLSLLNPWNLILLNIKNNPLNCI